VPKESMKKASTFQELRDIRTNLHGTFGLVPTMGALHAGHLSLVRRARAECANVGASIFVNPAQFGPGEDLSAYPRDLERDLALLEEAGVDLVWTPTAEMMYPAGFQSWITVEEVSRPLEGKCRPGHFRGVATVVAKLFNAFSPDRAYFGQKDAQQVVVIKRLVQDLNFPIQIVVCPTVREPDGLAMSSRNAYLSAEDRRSATVLYRALAAAEAEFRRGVSDPERLRTIMRSILHAEPRANVEYISIADPDSLIEVKELAGPVLLSLAVRLGKTRLIDNLLLGG
jgi:pantoate--beta-alanine ligase